MKKLKIIISAFFLLEIAMAGEITFADKDTFQKIENGYVIADGSYLSKPYEIIMKNGVIYINGTQYEPRIEKKKAPARDAVVSERTQKQHDLIVLIGNKYAHWAVLYGIDEAQKRLSDFLKKQEIVEDFKFVGEDLQITFQGEKYPEGMLLHTWRMQKEGRYLSPKEIEKLEKENRRERLKNVIEMLQGNGLLAFGDSYEVSAPFPQSEQWILDIKRIMESGATENEKEELLRKAVITGSLIKDILMNYDSWK